jgi:hypothetical protein
MATTSIFSLLRQARKTILPILPKPFIPILTLLIFMFLYVKKDLNKLRSLKKII